MITTTELIKLIADIILFLAQIGAVLYVYTKFSNLCEDIKVIRKTARDIELRADKIFYLIQAFKEQEKSFGEHLLDQ